MIKKLKVAMTKSGHSKPLAAVMIGISLPTLYSVLSGKVCSQLTENAIQRYPDIDIIEKANFRVNIGGECCPYFVIHYSGSV